MRIAIGGFAQESQSFSPVQGSWMHFGPQHIARGSEIRTRFAGTETEIGGALGLADECGIEIAPLLFAHASSSAGPVRADVFSVILEELTDQIRYSLPLDGLLLVLHGAMVAGNHEDATGEILRAAREALGSDVPLVGTLDLHANVTKRMVREATGLVGYHTAPHVDQAGTGRRGMALLSEAIAGRVRPMMALRRLPMLLPGETARTTDGPLAEVMALLREIEGNPGILDVSVFSVQPWLDVEDVGCSVLVVSDGAAAAAAATTAADRLAQAFWERRHRFEVELAPTADAIRLALSGDSHPVVLADSADAPSSGAPGDSTVVLRALLDAQPGRACYTNIVDPAAVASMISAGVGQEITLSVGGCFSSSLYEPLEVSGRVTLLCDGDFLQKGPGFHGEVLHRGLTGVLRIGCVELVVMERAVRQWDPELYRSVGLEPRDAQIVIVKSPAAFRAAYEPFAAEIQILDAAGVCSPDLRGLPFKKVRRPLYPLDEHAEWHIRNRMRYGQIS